MFIIQQSYFIAVNNMKLLLCNVSLKESFAPPCSDHSALHAQIPAAGSCNPQGMRRGVVPSESYPRWGRHPHLLLPRDCVHHRHSISESTGSTADLHTTTFPLKTNTIVAKKPSRFQHASATQTLLFVL